MRTMWKGHIRFKLVQFPIAVYKATNDMKKEVELHQFHKGECSGEIAYIKKCKKCEAILTNEEVTKGHLVDDDLFIEVSDADIESIKLKSTKVIEIEGFCDPSEIDFMVFEQPYFLGPVGTIAYSAYDVLFKGLQNNKRVAIASITMRDREDKVIIMAHNNALVMILARYPEEIRATQQIPDLEKVVPTDVATVKLMTTLMKEETRPFASFDLKNKYQEALKKLIADKQSKVQRASGKKEVRVSGDIMDALKGSIELAKKQAPKPVRAKRKKSA